MFATGRDIVALPFNDFVFVSLLGYRTRFARGVLAAPKVHTKSNKLVVFPTNLDNGENFGLKIFWLVGRFWVGGFWVQPKI
jgi:hypothetical protein